jgi:hypothetical protein
MSSLIQVALAETRQADVARAARTPRHQRSLPPPKTRPTRVRGAAATMLVRTALRLDAERAWRTMV